MKNESATNKSKIYLIDKYYFTADDNQYILMECGTRNKIDRMTRKVTDEIMEYEDILGYYSNLSSLIKACVSYYNRKAISSGQVSSLADTVEQIESVYSKINDMILI